MQTFDPTESIRRNMIHDINSRVESDDASRELVRLRETYGETNVWDTEQVRKEFEVLSFLAPFCSVRRKSDGTRGSLMFQHSPRFYFNFAAT